MSLSKRSLLAVGVGAFLAGCNTLSLFNRFTPKDGGVRRVARDVAFGDDPRQRYDVYAPAGKTGLPVLVFFYGGGWNSGSKDDYGWMGHALASMGYVVAVPDYRLVPDVLYPVFLEDNAAAVKHVLAHAADYGGDGARLGTIGQSAGGYAAAMMALDPRYLPESTINACVGIAGPYDFYPFDVPASINAFGKWARPEETQPITYARKVATKFLLLQSRADIVVGVHNAVNLEKKLRDAGTDVTLKLYDGLNHQDTAAVYSVPFRKKGALFEDTRTFLIGAL
ncbi:alpha/beta hydrolase domain-containing protein [Asticcacaulis biprosthecium C19]|uniref:Alpha/beta hydrolase domain-containing protein n=1 Tax=Asticcacaulis biprosthecium C19 TaxID=715226 RepID=F4QKF8_9CAUL|nr:alpha/beta hydrolase [Asticcacaulis biprosthecium]EGF92110.1 alpha/beta hydrolase domain-containing protein [Asticcacaulis biprosthecium C19]